MFLKISRLITEIGCLHSRGAIVYYEFGINTVLTVYVMTKQLKSEMRVKLSSVSWQVTIL